VVSRGVVEVVVSRGVVSSGVVRADRGLLEVMHRRATVTAGEFKPQGVCDVESW